MAGPHVERRGADLVVAAAAVVVVAVSALTPVNAVADYRIATVSAPSQDELLALATGTLEGRVNIDGTACLWLGQGLERMALLWPYRYTARGFPLAVYDASRKRVATVGRLTFIGGGTAPPDSRSILGCLGISRIWLVGHVSSQR